MVGIEGQWGKGYTLRPGTLRPGGQEVLAGWLDDDVVHTSYTSTWGLGDV